MAAGSRASLLCSAAGATAHGWHASCLDPTADRGATRFVNPQSPRSGLTYPDLGSKEASNLRVASVFVVFCGVPCSLPRRFMDPVNRRCRSDVAAAPTAGREGPLEYAIN